MDRLNNYLRLPLTLTIGYTLSASIKFPVRIKLAYHIGQLAQLTQHREKGDRHKVELSSLKKSQYRMGMANSVNRLIPSDLPFIFSSLGYLRRTDERQD